MINSEQLNTINIEKMNKYQEFLRKYVKIGFITKYNNFISINDILDYIFEAFQINHLINKDQVYQACQKCHNKLDQENKYDIHFKNLQTNSGYGIQVCRNCAIQIENFKPIEK